MPLAMTSSAPPPVPPPRLPPTRPSTSSALDRWREDDDDADWGVPLSRKEAKGKARAVEGDGKVGGGASKEGQDKAALRTRRAVASESWDADFDFHAPPLPSPRRESSRAASSSRSRPTTPLHRHTSSASNVPSTPSSRHASPPGSPRHGWSRGGPATLSLDSLASSIAWTSDQDPTLTVLSTAPPGVATTPRTMSREAHQSHHASASTATTRPPLSRQTTPRSRIPKLSPSPSRGTAQPSWTDSSVTTDSDYRADTPCLTEDSFNSLTTAEEEVVTEHEVDSGTEVALAGPVLPAESSSLGSRIKSISGSRKWRFGRRGSASREDPPSRQQMPPPPRPPPVSARRAGTPEVMVIDRHELSRARLSNSPRWNLPRPVSRSTNADGGKGSSSTVGSSSSSQHLNQRAQHSSGASVSTSSTSAGRSRRTSLHFAPPPIVPPSFGRRGSLASPHSPSESVAFSWREYSGATTEGEEDEDDDGETTGADLSDASGDEGARRPRRRAGRHAGQAARGAPRLAGAITPSTSFASTRPVSPVESILGSDRARWNASQVSFASSASAFALRGPPPSTGFVAGPGADATHGQGQKRKLTKRRPSSGLSPSSSAYDQLNAPSLLTSDRPLLAPSIFSNSSGGSSQPSSSHTVLHRARSYHRPPPPAPPFAEDSDAERAPRQRSVTNPAKKQRAAGERGQVVDMDDTEWLGVVPFPPSPRASLEAHGVPHGPAAPSGPPPRSSRILRKVSGAGGKSYPPVTGRTQGEVKAKRSSGLGQTLSNLLSRSTSALPLSGKRAPSPAPSAKSVKSSKSGLLRRPSSRASRITADEGSTPPVPKSPSLSALRKRSSGFAQPLPLSTSASVPALPAPASPRPLSSTASSSSPALPRSSSTFSFLRRPRAFSRTATKEAPASSPVSPTAAAPSSPSFDERPRAVPMSSRASRQSAASSGPTQATPRGQLNPDFKMPRPVSNVSTVSSTASGTTDATDSTLMPLGGFLDGSTPRAARASASRDVPPVPPLPRYMRARPGAAPMGHRPSLSLSSIVPLRSASPRPPLAPSKPGTPEPLPLESHRPVTALAGRVERDDEEALTDDDELALPRRNSLGDLRIPARITNAQKKIEEDLERVKQFARAVEDLKGLRRQYDQLIHIFAESPSSPANLTPDRPSIDALAKTAQAARRVEIDYSAWWEQAQTLIDLGDGKASRKERASPGTLASRRDRCVSLAPETTPPRSSTSPGLRPLPSESETETEAKFATSAVLGRNGSTAPRLRRRPSASSIETEASVAVRQREMLRGVLAPTMKGASLPSRAPPAPRPPLPRLDSSKSNGKRVSGVPRGVSHTISPTTPRSPSLPAATPLPAVAARRVSRGGVFGIREFLLRLRSKATEELAASVGSIPLDSSTRLSSASVAPSLGRRSVSDPSHRPHTPQRAGASHLRPSAPPLAAALPSTSSPGRISLSSESDEDWDADLAISAPSRNSFLDADESVSAAVAARRERTRSVIVAGAGAGAGLGAGKGGELMVLTTEAMPHLLAKAREVREACEACVGLLKGLTV